MSSSDAMPDPAVLKPQAGVIIVNWNSADYLRGCLSSLARCKASVQLQTIVIDNASFDGSETLVRTEYPGVQFVQLERNLGFGGASNLGASLTNMPYLLFLNPDTEVCGEAIERMLAAMRSLPAAGVLGCRLLNTDLTLQTSCVQTYPGVLNQLLDFEWLQRRTPRWPLWGNAAIYQRRPGPVPVDALSGACMLVRRSAFEKIGGFSPEYFMYSEDLDLCLKLKLAGFGSYYLDSAEVIHHGGKSSDRLDDEGRPAAMQREATWQFIRRHRGAAAANCYRVVMGASAILRLALLLPSYVLSANRNRSSIRRALTKWLSVFRWALFPKASRPAPGQSPALPGKAKTCTE